MSKNYDDAGRRGYLWPREEDTYDDCLNVDSGDEEIERIIEKQRAEYYDAWFAYIAEFE